MRKQLYQDIVDCLSAITEEQNGTPVPVFKHFDLWNQQVDFLQNEKPFPFPAIFIEFEKLSWEHIGQGVQTADMYVRIHVVTKFSIGNTASNVPEPHRSNALNYLDACDKVNGAMSNFAPTSGNRFMRADSFPNHNHETILDTIERFKCNVVDRSAQQEQIPVQVTPVISQQ